MAKKKNELIQTDHRRLTGAALQIAAEYANKEAVKAAIRADVLVLSEEPVKRSLALRRVTNANRWVKWEIGDEPMAGKQWQVIPVEGDVKHAVVLPPKKRVI